MEEVISTGKQESKPYLKSVKKIVPQPISDISFEKEAFVTKCARTSLCSRGSFVAMCTSRYVRAV